MNFVQNRLTIFARLANHELARAADTDHHHFPTGRNISVFFVKLTKQVGFAVKKRKVDIGLNIKLLANTLCLGIHLDRIVLGNSDGLIPVKCYSKV
jgi:hypothetical protein